MNNPVSGCALVAGVIIATAVAFVGPLAGQDAAAPAPQDGRGGGRAGRGGGRGAPAAPAGPIGKLPDGHPDMQGFWTPPAITDIEPAPGRGGARGGGEAR